MLTQNGDSGPGAIMGNAGQWDDTIAANPQWGYTIDNIPAIGSIALWENPGHVAYVEMVNGNTITISEDNAPIWNSFRWRTINTPGDWPDKFLHIKDLPPPQAQPEPSAYGDPRGAIDAIRRTPSGAQMIGWAFDPDTTASPINVDIYSGDGYATPQNYRAGVYANELNTSVGNTFGIDPYKGYTANFSISTGQHRLCMYGINVGPNGTTRRNNCSDLQVSGQPFGNLDQAYRAPGGAKFEGWSIDPDTAQAIDAHFFESDTPDTNLFRGGTTASLTRTDVENSLAGQYAGYGPNHGFSQSISLASSGTRHICSFALNQASTVGGSQKIGCADIVISGEPVGNLEAVDRL